MIDKYILGTAIVKVVGFNENELIEDFRKDCKVISLNKDKDAYYIEIYAFQLNKAKNICEKHGFVMEIIREKGIYFTMIRHLRRYGIYIGLLISIMLIFYFSNIIMKIEITGTDDEEIKSEILAILKSEGISPGVFIPSINFIESNLKLSTLCDDIAWSSIAHTGSVVKVDVALLTPKEEADSKRIPSNIIAKRDGVIVKAEILSGQLEVLIGNAVAKGDLLVSGIIERRNGVTYYYHSFGKILAQYDETVIIEQNYDTISKKYGKTHYSRSLRIFDADFSLPRTENSGTNFDIETDSTYLLFFGIQLPIGVATKKFTEVSYEQRILSTEEAFLEAYRLLDNYEKSILKDEEIVSRSIEEVMTEHGVSLVVNYKLIGEIGVQQEIFAK